MEHHQPAMLNFSVLDEYLELKSDSMSRSSASVAMDDQKNMENFIGVVEVCIHQARNIHNICIYQNQDVYAKVLLSDKPEKKISSRIINGGGRNPVFNETLRLDVPTMDSSLRCEVWMLSRIRNYLEDQLLGFVLVPFSDVVSESGKPAREFELSSSELFHSPAGFVELSFKYTGTSPEVMEMPKSFSSGANVAEQNADFPDSNICCELDRIEFPDQEIVNENQRMVSEYLSCPCDQLEYLSENDNNDRVKTDDHSLEKADGDQGDNVVPTTVVSPSKDSTPSVNPNPVSSETVVDTLSFSKSLHLEDPSLHKDSDAQAGGSISAAAPVSSTAQPSINVGIEPKQKMVQEEIVDMYMKGMQQFTDALAKMKLPMDIADRSRAEKNKSNSPEESSSDGKAKASKSPDPSPRVFYGSGAFF